MDFIFKGMNYLWVFVQKISFKIQILGFYEFLSEKKHKIFPEKYTNIEKFES